MPKNTQVILIDAKQLALLQRQHPEGDVLLVDVREPAEYASGHIPGAQLIPLLQLEARLNDLRPGPQTVFYCHSGQRSLRAAASVVMNRGLENIYSLEGGIIGWGGRPLPDFPNLRAFEGTGELVEVIQRAMDLEKGALRLYESFLAQNVGTPLEKPFLELASAELAHVRALYKSLQKELGSACPAFEELYGAMTGDILESGEDLDQVVARMNKLENSGPGVVLELALELELRAYDLYSKLAHREGDADIRKTFKQLAAQERRHAKVVLRGLETLAESRPTLAGYSPGLE